MSLDGDSSGVGDTVLVTLSVTPKRTYQNARLWFNVDSGGLNIIDPPEVEHDSIPANVEQTFQASVELGSAGRAVLKGGAGYTDDGDSTESLLSEELYLIVEPDRTSWSAAAFLVAAMDSLDHQLSSGQISQAEFDSAFLVLRTIPSTTTIEIDSSAGSLRSSSSDFVVFDVLIEWKDRNGTAHPFRYATVELIDVDPASDVVVATGMTDANGTTNFAFEPVDAFGRDLFVKIRFRSEGFYMTPPGRRDNSAEYISMSDTTVIVDISRDYRVNVLFDSKESNVHQALVMASRYVEDKSGTILSTIPVEYPSSVSWHSQTDYIQIAAQDGYDWDMIQAVYGYYVMFAFGFGNSPNSLGFHYNSAEQRGKLTGISGAWGNGWPLYFALTGQFESDGPEGVPDIRDTYINRTENINLSPPIEAAQPYISKGEDNVLTIARILWDLYDPANEEHDRIALGDDVIWNVMAGAGITTLSEFWNKLIQGWPLETQTEFGRIFAHHNVAPDPVEPPDFFPIRDLDSVPTFKWEKNGAGPSYKLNKFRLEFWDDNLETLLFSTPELDTNEYTPTPAELNSIFTDRSTCRWLVRGRNTDAPETGWYMSPARYLRYDVLWAFVIDDTGSMREEIDGVRDALLEVLNFYGSHGRDNFQLTTFKDEVKEGTPGDLATIYAEVEALSASGGAECPEASVKALRTVADAAARIFFATDASPHAGSNVYAAINELRARGVRVDVLSSGSCGSFRSPGDPYFSTIATNEPLMEVSNKAAPVDRGFVQLSSQSLTPLALGDNDFVEVALPFAFPFGGQDWNSAFVSADGYITFGEAVADPYPDRVFLQLGPPRIAGFWSTLNPGAGGQISAGEVDGEFHVVYDQVPFELVPDSVVSFTMILKSDGRFIFDLGQAQMPFDYGVLCGAAPGYLDSLGAGAERDLSVEPEPILENDFGTAYEAMTAGFSGGYDLAGERIVFAPVTYTPPPPPVEYTAFEAYTALARETGGIFSYQPEVNFGDSADKQRFENTIFNMIQGGLTSAIALVSPAEGPAGNTIVVSMTGSSTNFRSSTQVTFSGDGITVLDVQAVSPIELLVTLSIDPAATPGFRDVIAQTDLTGGVVETAAGVGAFEVTAPLLGPEIISVSPIAAQAGEDLVVTVYGGGQSPFVDFTDATAVDFGDGITVNSFQALSPLEIEASISIDSLAVSGPRDVVVTSPFYVFEEYINGPFFVTFPLPDRVQLTSVFPQSASPGASFSLSITGANTVFQDGLTTVSFSDTSIAVTDVVVSDSEHVTAQVQIDPTAPPGFLDVRVQTGDESLALLDAFLVLELACGDFDGDERIDVADIIYLITYLFLGGDSALDQYSGDVNCSGDVDIEDLSYMVGYIFLEGAAPCAACP